VLKLKKKNSGAKRLNIVLKVFIDCQAVCAVVPYGLFHNSNVFGACIIHILFTACAKLKKNDSGAKRLNIVLKVFIDCQAVCAVVPYGLFHNSNVFGPVLFTFYIQGVLKFKKNNSGAKRLNIFLKVFIDCQAVCAGVPYGLFRNSNVFGSCIIHILYTGCAKIKKKIIPAPNG